MSTHGRRVFPLVAVVIAVLALVAVTVSAATVAERGGEEQAYLEADAKARKTSNNEGKAAPGMCVYSKADNEHTFRNVPKADDPQDSDETPEILEEIEGGAQFADSPDDCNELNAIIANPPQDSGSKSQQEADFVKGAAESVPGPGDGPRDGKEAEPSPEALKGKEMVRDMEPIKPPTP